MPLLLKILAFGGALAAGVLCIYFAITYREPSLWAWAVAAIFGGITGFLFARSGSPTGSLDPSVGGKFLGLPDWVTYADFALVGIALILSFVL